jgi:hypothetical protein
MSAPTMEGPPQYGPGYSPQPQYHNSYSDYDSDPSHSHDHWEAAKPKVTVEEFMMMLEDTQTLERQFEFCKFYYEYGVYDVFREITESTDTKSKLQTIEYDYHRLKEEIHRMEERNHKIAYEMGYYHRNVKNNAIASHRAVSYQNPQNPQQWNMHVTQGQHFGQPGMPQQASHPNLMRGAAIGLGLLGVRLPPPAPPNPYAPQPYQQPPPRQY